MGSFFETTETEEKELKTEHKIKYKHKRTPEQIFYGELKKYMSIVWIEESHFADNLNILAKKIQTIYLNFCKKMKKRGT